MAFTSFPDFALFTNFTTIKNISMFVFMAVNFPSRTTISPPHSTAKAVNA
jgi:hypothetical protein